MGIETVQWSKINISYFFSSKVSSVWCFIFIFVFKANTVNAAASLNSNFLGIFKPTLQSSLCVIGNLVAWEIFLLELIYIVTEFLQKILSISPKVSSVNLLLAENENKSCISFWWLCFLSIKTRVVAGSFFLQYSHLETTS